MNCQSTSLKIARALVPSLLLVSLAWPAHAENAEVPPARDAVELRGEVYATLMRAMLAARDGEFREAASEVRRAVELNPESVELRIEAADLLNRIGRRDEAVAVAREALASNPEDPGVLLFLADRAAERALTSPRPDPETRDEALRLYEKLVELDAHDEQVLGRIASLRLQAGDRAGAIEAARTLIERLPGDRRATGSLAQLLIEDGREREALEVVLGYLVRHPDDQALYDLADELTRRLHAWDLVDAVFGAEPDAASAVGPARDLHGEALLQLGEFERAVTHYEQLSRLDPDNLNLRFNLARAYRRVGRLADAAVVIGDLVESAEGMPAAHATLLLAETLEDQGDVAAAIESFSEALEIFSTVDGTEYSGLRDTVRRRIAALRLGNQELEQTARMLRQLEQTSNPESQELIARLAIAEENWDTARTAAQTLESMNQDGVSALLEGEILARTGRWAKADAAFRSAIEALGPMTRVRIAEICLELKRADQGLSYVREWVETVPQQADARYYMGYVLFLADRFEDSEVELREAFRIEPQHAPALNFLGYSLAERGERLDEALELIQRALVLDAWNGAYLDSLGWVYHRMQRHEEARDPMERAAREHPRDPVVLEHLGDVYLELGEADLALAAWNRALKARPEDESVLRSKIAELRGKRDLGDAADRAVQEALDHRLQRLNTPYRP